MKGKYVVWSIPLILEIRNEHTLKAVYKAKYNAYQRKGVSLGMSVLLAAISICTLTDTKELRGRQKWYKLGGRGGSVFG